MAHSNEPFTPSSVTYRQLQILKWALLGIMALVAVGYLSIGLHGSDKTVEVRTKQVRLAYSGPAALASAASRGFELPDELGLQYRYLLFAWQLEGEKVRGKCIYSASTAGAVQGPNCYRTAQIHACNAYQSTPRSDGKFETVGLTTGEFHSVGLRSGGRTFVVPSRNGVFVVETDARVTACVN